MKNFLALIILIFSISIAYAVKTSNHIYQSTSIQKVIENKPFSKIFGLVDKLKQKIYNYNISERLLRLALILMVIGLVLLIIADSVKDNGIIYAVGAVFFLIGAIILLFDENNFILFLFPY